MKKKPRVTPSPGLEAGAAPSPGRERPDVELREMVLEDLPKVFALGERLFTADRWPTLYRTWDEYELVEFFASEGEFCWVAEREDNGAMVGFALGTLIEKRRSAWKYGYLVWIGVDPACAGSGVGGKLVRRLTDLFIARGARMMLVDTEADNDAAIRFFERQGFGQPEPHVYLMKNLTQDPSYQRHRAKTTRPTKPRAAAGEETAND